MAFSDEKSSSGKKANWGDKKLYITPEHPVIIQILEAEVSGKNPAQVIWKHYIPQARRKNGGRGIDIVCPGYNVCPICQRNAELGDKTHPDYIAAHKKFVVNVLELTARKVCPLCGKENYGNKCTYDDNDLKEVKPEAPVVKLLEGSSTFFTQLSGVEEMTTKFDPEGNEVIIGWTHYPMKISVAGEKRDKVYSPIPLVENDIKVEDFEKDFIKIEDAYVILNAAEIQELLAGGSLSDVLKARYESTKETQAEDSIGDEVDAL
jgi:hypothetical protein